MRLLACVVLATLLAPSVGMSQTTKKPDEPSGPAKSAVKWEYLELVNNDKGNCSYSTAKEVIGAESWQELAKKLQVPLKDGDKVGNARLVVFDFLGGQGWELVSHGVMVINAGYGETFFFKRRLEK